MFCKECGAEIPDDSKHCKECGANLIEDESKENNAQINEEKSKEKKKFNKKWLIGCCIGIIIIFGVVAYMSNSSDVDGKIYNGLYKALSDDGYDIGLHEKDSHHKQLNVFKDNVKILINISTSSEYFDELYREGVNHEIHVNNVTAYDMVKDGRYYLIYKDNNNTISFLSDEGNSQIIQKYVRDY